ncbi:hypothetical protein PPL_06383 [Heterostelium album PN500]|uniref:Uncharacterized protein n=1 Tax=Heterostelium pallidum (strain ATCC 26659 / Pp 5 / PN500) TaxID=670386 RepID=D3BD05_HETP5|nr:hypothetical protein PPL_06383 [Heterostelium album PN500]EFA80797.1 hypothetical protein PPL_06383 [Heterostelium album PN500]|eukprot:XP_020432916.1 hypothetical protein PPL_06383 [Heterostelium album PN500]
MTTLSFGPTFFPSYKAMAKTDLDEATTTANTNLLVQSPAQIKAAKQKMFTDFASFTCFSSTTNNGLTTYTNFIQQAAQTVFNGNMLYNADANVLTLLGITKPKIDVLQASLFSDAASKTFYQSYAAIYFPYALYNAGDSFATANFNITAIQNSLNTLSQSAIFAAQTMLCTSYAFKAHYTGMIGYMSATPVKSANQYAKHVTNATYLKNFITKHASDNDLSSYFRDITDIKTLLDTLDPTGTASQTAVNGLNGAMFIHYFGDNNSFANTILVQSIQNQHILNVLTSLQALQTTAAAATPPTTPPGYVTVAMSLINALGGFTGAVTYIQSAIQGLQQQIISYKLGAQLSTVLENYGGKLSTILHPHLDPNFTITVNVKKLLVSLWRSSQIAVIGYGIANWNNMSTFDKTLMVGTDIAIFADILTSIKTVDKVVTHFFSVVGKTLTNNVIKYMPSVIAKGVSSAFPTIFTATASEFILARFCPVLVLGSAVLNVIDVVNDAKTGNIGALVLDFGQAVANLATVGILMASFSWSGPVALVLGGVAVILALIKFIAQSMPSDVSKTYWEKYLTDSTFKTNPNAEIIIQR